MALNNLSVDLGKVGRRAESLAAGEEAAGLYRDLAEANPAAHLPELAMSLNTLSDRLGAVGRRDEALATIDEAVAIHRTLAEANPDLFGPALQRSLDMAVWLEA
ncbi:tetratricopeptide repeat protein [Streptomyces sp. LS1784]|uniref:tetratricopeptide repeat protein n=1 Tax=Streptomyces sp. LS1784 TaxID=2851533 RepID=UPI001CCEF89A|nr:tetratricopeptide repeat protein [Streptomyces sp. LS1784]